MRLIAATNNPHKIREFRRILLPLGIEVITPDDLGLSVAVEETGTTFAENALLKARAFAAGSGLPALADDSGIVVDALGGEPGIYSARYGGPGLDDAARTNLLLSRLANTPPGARSARFVAAVALVQGSDERVFEGTVEGVIAPEARGHNGFGYDPVFYYPPFGHTFGEVAPERKDTVSHRARALNELARYLRNRA
ncbi:MAG TPA: RdgB/HAM1 family non-canonical purine NTP pyrophosphatase [Chloroflexota bacterium]|nr:RdgB/HAM1 family non-canonical purine NTP pyrophosphatase [Chloroflexota bacterium]